MEANKRNEWKDYISKLNERRINKQKSSGFTLWALLGILGVLGFNILSNLEIYFNNMISSINFLLIFSLVVNISTTLFLCFFSVLLFFSEIDNDRRFKSKLSKKSEGMVSFPTYALLFLMAILNLYILVIRPEGYSFIPFLVFGLLFLFNSFGHYLRKLIHIKASKNKMLKGFEIKNPEISTSKGKNIIQTTYLFMFSFLILLVGIQFIDLYNNIDILSNSVLIKISFELVTIFVIIIIIFKDIGDGLEYKWIENLERRIIMENLTVDEIEKEFVKNYLGSSTLDFIKDFQDELKAKYELLLRRFDKSEEEFKKLKKNKEKGNSDKNKICDVTKNIFDNYKKYTDEVESKIRTILAQGPIRDEEERMMEIIVNDWRKQIQQIEKRYRDMCKLCSEIDCNDKRE